jgi:hypothetical protein
VWPGLTQEAPDVTSEGDSPLGVTNRGFTPSLSPGHTMVEP